MVMNYELAKQLADAGFPQIGKGRTSAEMVGFKRIETYYFTLEELIQACGQLDEHLVLTGSKDEWMALCSSAEASAVLYSTPTEAVARLWLALNSK
jgi:hypothetical protein